MKKINLLIACTLFLSLCSFAKGDKDSLQAATDRQLKLMDSVENALKWETNTVIVANGIATIKLTKGFKFLNKEQSQYVLHDLWGNPPREDVLGMIFPADGGPFSDSSFAFIVSFEEDGYVRDDEADKINYDEMLREIKAGEAEINQTRSKNGYEPMYILGWASKPYYDKTNKVLHWAKEIKFGTDEIHTLNYDVRVLGRKGILSLNAVATMNELSLVKANIDDVLKMPEFTDGNKYSDFNSNTDKVAEYGIGALVAGGILAKTGVFAMIGKFLLAAWKFIIMALLAAGAGIKKFFTAKRRNEDHQDTVTS